jgi:hypothetical protein
VVKAFLLQIVGDSRGNTPIIFRGTISREERKRNEIKIFSKLRMKGW